MASLNPFNLKKKLNLPKRFLYIVSFFIIIIFLFLVIKMLKNQSIEKFDTTTNSTNINSTKKIAFCFLTIDNLNQNTIWTEFFKGNEERYSIYFHPKHPDRVDEPYKKCVIQNLIETKWGHTSLVQATLNLFKTAHEDENNKICILVSDSCIPLYNFDYIYNKLINEYNCSNILSLKDLNEPERKKRYSVLKNNNPDFLTFQQFKKCSQWCAINRETVKFLIENNYLHYYKNMNCSDEHYFINLFDKFNISYKTFNITFDNWKNFSKNKKYRALPKTYEEVNENEIKEARYTQALFFRKVVPETSINMIKILSNN